MNGWNKKNNNIAIHNNHVKSEYYRKPFGGPADPVKNLDPILTGFWPKGGAARAAAH